MFGKDIGILQSGIIRIIELLKSKNTLLDWISWKEVCITREPIHHIHLFFEVYFASS